MQTRFIPCLLASASIVLMVSSCQKELNPRLDAPIGSDDPQTLSASLKVWHGVRTQGQPPAPSGVALQLDNAATGPIYAFAGRYAIFKPEVVSGDVEGYYVKLNGASEYFKVDYSKPRNINGRLSRPGPGKNSPFLNRTDSTGGNMDSSIVVVLPASIQVPDTFCITYWAYDAANNVSNPATVCIVVGSLGPDAGGSWLNGSWRFTSSWENGMAPDTVIYNRWITDTKNGGYYCENGVLDMFDNGSPRLVADSIIYRKAHLTFGNNGAQRYESDYSYKFVDMSMSTCSQFFFQPVTSENETMTGAWSFNSNTNKMVLIFEFDDLGVPVQNAWEYDVIRVNNNNFILVDNFDPAWPYYLRMEK